MRDKLLGRRKRRTGSLPSGENTRLAMSNLALSHHRPKVSHRKNLCLPNDFFIGLSITSLQDLPRRPCRPLPMKVAIVVHDFDSRFGQGRYCVELARRLREEVKLTVYANTCQLDELPPGVTYRHIPAFRQRALTTIGSFLV